MTEASGNNAWSALTQDYLQQLQALIQQQADVDEQQILACLITRDQIAYLQQKEGPPTTQTARNLERGDEMLRQLLPSISQLPKLKAWRSSFTPPAEAWWWPEPVKPTPAWPERLNWLWTGLALVGIAISVSLILDISSRFLSGDTDAYGILAIILPTVLTLLTTRSILTDTGKKAIQHAVEDLSFIPSSWREELGFAASLILLLLLTLFWFSLPVIAKSYNNSGYDKYTRGEFSSAIAAYERALALDPGLLEARYNLGVLYEDLNQPDQAQTDYQLAVQGYKLDAAYNNLARLYILAENYDAAIPLLLTVIHEKLAQDDSVKYNIQKNLGWARLGQQRYPEAAEALQEAIRLDQHRAPAYCLMAQVAAAQEAPAQTIEEAWTNCIRYIDQTDPDEDRWFGLAQQYFIHQDE